MTNVLDEPLLGKPRFLDINGFVESCDGFNDLCRLVRVGVSDYISSGSGLTPLFLIANEDNFKVIFELMNESVFSGDVPDVGHFDLAGRLFVYGREVVIN